MEAGGAPGYPPTIARPLTPVAGRSDELREDPAKGGGERVRIVLLAEPAVVAREDHRLGPKSLRHGQRGAVGGRAPRPRGRPRRPARAGGPGKPPPRGPSPPPPGGGGGVGPLPPRPAPPGDDEGGARSP